jgi:hypothetical protein
MTAEHGAGPPDWTVQAADTIDAVVGVVRDKATIPLRTIVRAVVYGVGVVTVVAVALVLVVVAGVRALAVYLPVGRVSGHHRVWVAYLILGGIFTLAGLFLLRKAEATRQDRK